MIGAVIPVWMPTLGATACTLTPRVADSEAAGCDTRLWAAVVMELTEALVLESSGIVRRALTDTLPAEMMSIR